MISILNKIIEKLKELFPFWKNEDELKILNLFWKYYGTFQFWDYSEKIRDPEANQCSFLDLWQCSPHWCVINFIFSLENLSILFSLKNFLKAKNLSKFQPKKKKTPPKRFSWKRTRYFQQMIWELKMVNGYWTLRITSELLLCLLTSSSYEKKSQKIF